MRLSTTPLTALMLGACVTDVAAFHVTKRQIRITRNKLSSTSPISPCDPRHGVVRSVRSTSFRLWVSSSSPERAEDGSSDEKMMDLEGDSGVQKQRTDDQWMDLLVQGGFILAAVAAAYFAGFATLAALSGMASSVTGAFTGEVTKELSHLLAAFASIFGIAAMAIWNGLHFIVPIIFKAIYQLIQMAIPVVQQVSTDFVEYASPYVQDVQSELTTAASPYVEQLNSAIQEAADTAVVEPLQRATESISSTIDTNVGTHLEELHRSVDAAVVVPIQGLHESLNSIVDMNQFSVFQHAQEVVQESTADPTSNIVDLIGE